jgi:DNA-binding GntR family transcriptional regulator
MEVNPPALRVTTPPAAPARERLADAAYAALKASILEGLLPPGVETAEQAVADQLGMSRTPVHEAALRLQHEGMLLVLPRKGLRVLPLDPEDLRQTYEVLVALEGAAAALLAVQAQPVALVALERATAEMGAALARGDRAAWAAADDRFHRALVEGCGNPKLARLAATATDQAQRARALTAARRPEPRLSAEEHAAILAALQAADPEAARAATAQHRARASAEILGVLRG